MPPRSIPARPLALAVALAWVAAGCAPANVAPGPTPSGAASPSAAPAASPSAATPSGAPSAGASPTASVAPAGSFKLTGLVANIDRDPQTGVPVTAKRGDEQVATVQTDKDGRYALDLAAGEYTITTTKPGHTSRSQVVKLAADAVLNFGPTIDDQANPHFLADTPEIDHVEVDETAPAGPLKLRVVLSEGLPEKSRIEFEKRFELRANQDEEFLRVGSFGDPRLRTTHAWDADGKVFTFEYAGPYMPSGAAASTFTVKLRQEVLDSIDPETDEKEWEDMGIVDAAGNALGRGRAAFAFKKPQIFPPAAEMLTDRDFGFYVQDRRWRLSHDAGATFTAKADAAPPEISHVELQVDEDDVDFSADVLRLTFNKPMAVARDREELDWTRLDKDKPPVLLNVSRSEAGTNLEPANPNLRIRKIEVDYDDPRIVYVYYPLEAFKDYEFVEVTLTPDAQDPAGNKPDAKRNRLGGKIVGG